MIRFEILLPLFYNDGRQIEWEKFIQTDAGGSEIGQDAARRLGFGFSKA